MARLLLILSMALFLAGCATKCPQEVRVYRPEFLQQQGAFTGSPAGLVFDPPALAYSGTMGLDQIEGVNLNQRTQLQSTNGVYDLGSTTWYQLYNYERQPNPPCDTGYLNRTLIYYTQGTLAR